MTEPVTFEIAKLLKEKEFDKRTMHYYFEDGEFKDNKLTGTNGYYGEEYSFSYNEFLENWNDKWLTKKNGDRCFGCSKSHGYLETYSAPTISEVVMWLYEKHGIWIGVQPTSVVGKFQFRTYYNNKSVMNQHWNDSMSKEFSSPIEAYEAAIEYTLNNLIK